MSETASGGVSRSGRLRKKSAKLMEMETESTGVVTKQSTSKCSTPEVDSGKPQKKKIKIKLSLGPHPTIVGSDDDDESDALNDHNEKYMKHNDNSDSNSSVKKSIPPLKISKSKISGVSALSPPLSLKFSLPPSEATLKDEESVINNTPSVVVDDDVTTKTEMLTPLMNDDDGGDDSIVKSKSKPKRVKSNVKRKVNKQQIKDNDKDIVNEELDTNGNVSESLNHVSLKHSVTDNVIPIQPEKCTAQETRVSPIQEKRETKILVKTKKKETETAANRIFRQITSGVTPLKSLQKSRRKNRKKIQTIDAVNSVISDDEFGETSLVIETNDSISMVKPKKKIKKITKITKITKIIEKRDEKKLKRPKKSDAKPKKRGVITAYTLWSKENRSKIQQTTPSMDFASVSRKLGEIWQALPKKDKMQWKRKAQKLSGKGSSIISTGKPMPVQLNRKIPTPDNSYSGPASSSSVNQYDDSCEEPRPIGTSPIDVAAHLRLLGESLTIIGQRLKEHSGQIAVSGSLSVLLDSTLCAIGPLLCLTQLDPDLDGCPQEIHMNTLDNIAYIMPGI